MKDYALYALECAQRSGVTYADVRFDVVDQQIIATQNYSVVTMAETNTSGIGIRVLWQNKGWGFASTSTFSKRSIERTARQAIANAKASAALTRRQIVLAPTVAYQDVWSSPCAVDPFTVSREDKIALLIEAARLMRGVKGIEIAEGFVDFIRTRKLFVSSIGSVIDQRIYMTGCEIRANAQRRGDSEMHSFPFCLGGEYQSGGMEVITKLDLPGHAVWIAEEANATLMAPYCPQGTYDIILGPNILGMQLHETAGHPFEGDRVDRAGVRGGWEANFAGGTFLKPENRRQFRFGSDQVTIRADATIPGGVGSYGYDDDGVPGQSFLTVDHGVLNELLTSRETAGEGEASLGAARAALYSDVPLVRMTNISLMPGNAGSLEELISDTNRGIYLDRCSSFSVCSRRRNFQFCTQVGWLIRNGKRVGRVRNPSYQGETTNFWGSCDAVCGPQEFVLCGVDCCAKGQPEQCLPTGHGSSPARFRGVNVGRAQRQLKETKCIH
jgi:TldD protein